MADHFISYSAPMIRAQLEDRKTQTRRALKTQPRGTPWFWAGDEVDPKPGWFDGYEEGRAPCGAAEREVNDPIKCYAVGDRLWVKEEWRKFVSLDHLKPVEVWSKDQDRGAGIS